MGHFEWIAKRIATKGENVVWVIEGSGVVSQKIEKNTRNFKSKTGGHYPVIDMSHYWGQCIESNSLLH